MLGDLLRLHGAKKDVQFPARDGSSLSVHFEVTDATRAILSAKWRAEPGALTIVKPHDGGKIIEDARAIRKFI